MGKDPAFLFYPGDWMGGTHWMTFEQKGCYLELLILQFNVNQFTEAQAKQVLSICFANAWDMIKQKFEKEGEFYYNKRLREEINKRKNYTESRRINGSIRKIKPIKSKAYEKHMLKHMENENENENIDVIKDESIKEIPDFETFKKYAIENKPKIDINELELKYKSWVVNGWVDGKGKKILNWKSKLLNTLKYISEITVVTNGLTYR